MRQRSGPTIEHRMVAARLRRLREHAGLSLAEAAGRAGTHPATLSRTETAQGVPPRERVVRLLEIYGAGDERRREVLDLLEAAGWDGWWHAYRDVMPGWMQDTVGLEGRASVVRGWCPGLVPELLRTDEYAYALRRLRSPEESPARASRAVELLRERVERLGRGHRPGGPAALWMLTTTAALRTAVGGPGVTRRQYRYLEEVRQEPRVTLQILPDDAPPHPLTGCGGMRLLRLPLPEIPDVLLRHEMDGAHVTDDAEVAARYRQALDIACVSAPSTGRLPLVGPAADPEEFR